MYKSRFRLWIIVLAVFLIINWVAPLVIPAIKQSFDNRTTYPKTATFSCNNNIVKKTANGKSVKRTDLVYTNSDSNANIIIKENSDIEEDGYKTEAFYSPLVIIMRNKYVDGSIFEDISNSSFTAVREADLKLILDGFLEDKKWKEIFACSSNAALAKHPINLCVDSKYEDEIKLLFIIELSSKMHPDEEDIEKYMPTANAIWEKATKIDTMDSYLTNLENDSDNDTNDAIVITPEYYMGNHDSDYMYEVSFSHTVGIEFSVGYTDGYENVVTNEKFMKATGIRRVDYIGQYNKGCFDNADWVSNYTTNMETYLSVKESMPVTETNTVNTNTENTTVNTTAETTSSNSVVKDEEDIIDEEDYDDELEDEEEEADAATTLDGVEVPSDDDDSEIILWIIVAVVLFIIVCTVVFAAISDL